MSQYYKGKRTRNLYSPASPESFALSRSKLELFLNCPRCFYIDRRLGVGQPPGFPFNLNSAVDTLLKKEFDKYRILQNPHPLMKAYGLDLVPFQHENMDKWRHNFTGVRFLHEPTNLEIFGAVDDLWTNGQGDVYVVDYKATSKNGEVNLNADWQIGYKRQMEIYQWLMRQNGFKVSDVGYFVYCNGKTDVETFDGKLEFDVKILPYTGNDSWVEDAITQAHACLNQDEIPAANPDCDYCTYFKSRGQEEKK